MKFAEDSYLRGQLPSRTVTFEDSYPRGQLPSRTVTPVTFRWDSNKLINTVHIKHVLERFYLVYKEAVIKYTGGGGIKMFEIYLLPQLIYSTIFCTPTQNLKYISYPNPQCPSGLVPPRKIYKKNRFPLQNFEFRPHFWWSPSRPLPSPPFLILLPTVVWQGRTFANNFHTPTLPPPPPPATTHVLYDCSLTSFFSYYIYAIAFW